MDYVTFEAIIVLGCRKFGYFNSQESNVYNTLMRDTDGLGKVYWVIV